MFDSVSVATTFRDHAFQSPASSSARSAKRCASPTPSSSRNIMGSVVPPSDNFFAALNSAVFTDGSFVFIPKGVACPMELSTYFRINARNTGQFERTLIICRRRRLGQLSRRLHRPACATKTSSTPRSSNWSPWTDARIKYSTVQNWYPGDADGRGGIYNFVTKRGICRGARVENLLDAGRNRQRPSPGNTRAASCRVRVPASASSIQRRGHQ